MTIISVMNRNWTLVGVAMMLLIASSGAFVPAKAARGSSTATTNTPIKHLIILFQENVSFDHYFGTYPNATSPSGQPKFVANPNTPSINGLTAALQRNNPNGNYSINPMRLDRSQAITYDMNHEYTAEQNAYHWLLSLWPFHS